MLLCGDSTAPPAGLGLIFKCTLYSAKGFCISEAEVCSNSVHTLTSVELKIWQEILLLVGLGITLPWRKRKHLSGTYKLQYFV